MAEPLITIKCIGGDVRVPACWLVRLKYLAGLMKEYIPDQQSGNKTKVVYWTDGRISVAPINFVYFLRSMGLPIEEYLALQAAKDCNNRHLVHMLEQTPTKLGPLIYFTSEIKSIEKVTRMLREWAVCISDVQMDNATASSYFGQSIKFDFTDIKRSRLAVMDDPLDDKRDIPLCHTGDLVKGSKSVTVYGLSRKVSVNVYDANCVVPILHNITMDDLSVAAVVDNPKITPDFCWSNLGSIIWKQYVGFTLVEKRVKDKLTATLRWGNKVVSVHESECGRVYVTDNEGVAIVSWNSNAEIIRIKAKHEQQIYHLAHGFVVSVEPYCTKVWYYGYQLEMENRCVTTDDLFPVAHYESSQTIVVDHLVAVYRMADSRWIMYRIEKSQ